MVSDGKQKDYLHSIKIAGKTLLTLINDILDLSKIEAGHLVINYELIDINRIFYELQQIFAIELTEKGLDFIMDVDEILPSELLIDEIRIRQVLLNLIGNAVKFTETGFIKLNSHKIDRSESNKIDLVISITDTGIGIPKDQQEVIFKSFRQQDGQSTRKYGGTGLGLAITKRLLKMMNGQISIESQVGVGSIFKITLQNIEFLVPKIAPKKNPTVKTKMITFTDSKIDDKLSEQISNITDITLLIKELESIKPLLQDMLGVIEIDVVERFAEQIIILGNIHNSKYLTSYAHKLLEFSQSFDIVNIEKYLAKFPNILNEIKDSISTT
jgi:hypothetical protein